MPRRYYAGQKVPGIDNPGQVFCSWVDRNGDIPTTGFQVHWPEFDAVTTQIKSLDYYCGNKPPLHFYTNFEPSSISIWRPARNIFFRDPSVAVSPAVPSPKEKGRRAANLEAQGQRLAKRFEQDPRIIKSHFPDHRATELCDRAKHAAGQSFVSFAEQKFCYMPTKTVFSFCETVNEGACWSDADNKVISKGNKVGVLAIPDLSHITETIVWDV